LKNLVDLTPQSGDPNNHARTFWRWLRKQSWRWMLPEPVAFLDCSLWSSKLLVHLFETSCGSKGGCSIGRSRPRESLLHRQMACSFRVTCYLAFSSPSSCSGSWLYNVLFDHSLRFASIYKYDWNLFKERFLGPNGVSW